MDADLELDGLEGSRPGGVRDLDEPETFLVQRQPLVCDSTRSFAYNESNLRISACEYEAPMTFFES